MHSYKKLIFALLFTTCGQVLHITPNAQRTSVVQPTFSTFWEWKIACNKKNPLTQEAFISELQAFVESQNNGPLSDQNNWVKTGHFGKQKPSPEFYTTTKFEPYVQKLEIPSNAEVAFHGDVHGDIKSFNAFIEDLNTKGYMDSLDPFKITKPNFYIIMLGDYTDRGQYGAEVLYAVLRMKRVNPNNFFMVRGNHEDLNINARYGLAQELRGKFANPSGIMETINKTYNYLPVALYLKSGTNALQCCHGGMEIGFYNIKKLLATSEKHRFILLDTLKRKTCINELPSHAQEAFSCIHISDINEYGPSNVGFMWNDFTFEPESNLSRFAYVNAIRGRGYEYPQQITQYLLKRASTQECVVRGVFRAHQHNHATMECILNRNGHTHAENTGVAKLWPPHDHMQQPAHQLWDGIVCTFCVSPGAYGSSFNYNFDSYGILTTAQNFYDWRLEINRLFTTQ